MDADFDAYHAASGEECSYWEMRVEVAQHRFHGNVSFTPQDAAAHSEAHSHPGGISAAGITLTAAGMAGIDARNDALKGIVTEGWQDFG